MTSVRADQRSTNPMPTDRDHGRVMHGFEFVPNCTIEFLHQTRLFKVAEMSVHQSSKLFPPHGDGLTMATHIGKSNANDVAAGTHRQVVDISAGVAGAEWAGMDPRH